MGRRTGNRQKPYRLLKYLSVCVVTILIALGVFGIATQFVRAETLEASIYGESLTDGTWAVGSNTVVWTAQVYDSDMGSYVNFDDGGKVVWTSSNPDIVGITVSTQGTESVATLKPLSGGTATVTVTYRKEVSTAEGTYELIATKSQDVTVKFEINSASIPTAPYEDDWTIPNYKTNSATPVVWTSANQEVLTVEDDGKGNGIVSIRGAGSTTVTATTADGQMQSFPVVVNAKFIESSSGATVPYGQWYTLSTNALTATNIYYTSLNEEIVTVSQNGTAYGVSAGVTQISIYAVNETHPWFALLPAPPRTLNVTVPLAITTNSTIVTVGDTLQMGTNIASDKMTMVNWTSSNTAVAKVDAYGLVTGNSRGSARITATVVSEELFGTTEMQTAYIDINVIDSLGLSEVEKLIRVDESFELSAIVTDESAEVTWVSSDESIARIEPVKDKPFAINVIGYTKGVVTITAIQIIDGVEKTASCIVTVSQPVVDIELTPTEVRIVKGEKYRIVATFTPMRPDNMNIAWITSDPNVVTVDQTGVITGVAGGQAAISVITEDGMKVATCTVYVREPVTGIKLDVHQVTRTLADRNYQLTYVITPDGEGVNRKVIWSSSAPDVATVNENGLVTFLKPGVATIIAKTEDAGLSGNLIDTCEFHIEEPVTGLTLDFSSVRLDLGETFRVTAVITPDDATNKVLKWISSDTGVVSVNENGLLTAVGSGVATVICQSVDSGINALCNVTVNQPVTHIKLSNSSMTVRKGQVFWLNATCYPENALNKEVAWSSDDTSIATVDKDGKVTTLKPGNCVIKATSQDSGVSEKCILTVLQPVTGITLDRSDETILVGESFVLVPTVMPEDADNKNVIYTSNDTSVATVDEHGVVTGVSGGRTVIIAQTEERGLVASCMVTVQEYVSSVKITTEVTQMNIGEELPLKVEVLSTTASNRAIRWSSSDRRIIEVDKEGRIAAKREGTALIYAYATDGSGLYDYISIKVIRGVASISIQPSSVIVREGKTAQVTATVYPSNATIGDYEWSSSDPAVADVDFTGLITGITAGTCKIFATSLDGNEIVGVCKVTVTKAIPATSVVISSSSITMLPGQTRSLSARIRPANATEDVLWSSGDNSVATVSEDGVVTARGQGITRIYAYSNETGVEGYCDVVVLAMNASAITIGQYDTYDLDVFGATEPIKWYSGNKRVATVTQSGQVVARMPGTAIITAKVNGKVLYCTVTVTNLY